MKICITGHTSGLGKGFYDHFHNLGHEVTGMSRSNGFDISIDIKKIVEISEGCDLFINNAYHSQYQSILLLNLKNKVKKIIVCGSSIRHHIGMFDVGREEYARHKYDLAELCKLMSLRENGPDILHLDLSYIQDFVSNTVVSIEEIINVVTFWLLNPKITEVSFPIKMCNYTQMKLKNRELSSDQLETLISKITKLNTKLDNIYG